MAIKCEKCGKELIGFGDNWLHPPNKCEETDGMEVRITNEAVYKKWCHKYGTPSTPPGRELYEMQEKKIKELEDTIKNNKLKKFIKKIKRSLYYGFKMWGLVNGKSRNF